jgi:hypothetical protein
MLIGEISTVMRKVFWLFLIGMTAGCANSGVRNSADFATSLNSLAKREVLFNLRKVYEEGATFVPSHVVVSGGKSTTSFTVNPSFSIPLGPGFNNTITSTGNNSFTGTTAFGAPVFTLGGNGTMSQDWTMTPATDVDALMRLRSLYLYVAGQMGVKAGDEERQFLCSYPVQRRPIVGLSDTLGERNIAYRLNCRGKTETVFYADPSFVTMPNCIVCITTAGLANRNKRMEHAATANKAAEAIFLAEEVELNSRLKHCIVYPVRSGFGDKEPCRTPQSGDRNLTQDLKADSSRQETVPELSPISIYLSTQVYLRAGYEEAFRDFILFTYAAMAPATSPK